MFENWEEDEWKEHWLGSKTLPPYTLADFAEKITGGEFVKDIERYRVEVMRGMSGISFSSWDKYLTFVRKKFREFTPQGI